MADDGGRLSLHLDKPGAGPERHLQTTAAALAGASIACIDLAEESRPLLARAKAAGCTVVCDLHDYDGENPFHDGWIAAGDVLFLNDDGMRDPLPWMREQVGRGTALVVVTQGAAGATAMTADETVHVPAERVDDVVDTNGAGDAFVAGFLHARLGRAALRVAMAAGHRQAARCLASPDLAPGRPPSPLLGLRPRAHQHLAGPDEPVRTLVRRQRLMDLGPRVGALALGEPGHQLVERPERLLLEAHALRSGRQQHRRGHAAYLHVGEARVGERLLEHAVTAQRERPGLAGQRRAELGPPTDDADGHGEERVGLGRGVGHDRDPAAVAQGRAHAGQSARARSGK